MKNICVLLLFFLNLTYQLSAQGRRNVWRLGYATLIEFNFNSGNIIVDSLFIPNHMWMQAEDASICDNNGNLLFYTNGVYIANALHAPMLNGNDLNPGPYATNWSNVGLAIPQGAIILPDPTDTNQYYLIHSAIHQNLVTDTLMMTKIDMRLDNGLGAVTIKNQPLYIRTMVSGQMTAVKHGNGRDWWLIAHEFNTDVYLKFLITNNGINAPILQHIGLPFSYPGQACFSPNGEKYASYDNANGLHLMDFDRCTGKFSNFQHFTMPDQNIAWGCCFSPNSQVLYVSSRIYLYQFNLNAANIGASRDTIATWDGFTDPYQTNFSLQQLAPNGKIYIGSSGSTKHFHVINAPDSLGVACNVQQHAIVLPGRNINSIPNYPFYELGSSGDKFCDSLHTNINATTLLENKIEIFPNPVSKVLYITKTKNESINSLVVYNTLGQNQMTNYFSIKNSEYLEVNVSILQSGIYFLEIKSDTQKIVKRFVKE